MRYGVAYLRMMERLPDSVRENFMKGDHTIHLRAGLWNGIWSDMGIETTWMKKGHGPGAPKVVIVKIMAIIVSYIRVSFLNRFVIHS